MLRTCLRSLYALLAVAAVLAVVAVDADARSRSSAGSRGSRTYSAPPPTATAPGSVSPIQRSATQPSSSVTRTGAPASATGGFFNRPGFLGGLAGGLLGAGLFGLLFGHGLAGGLGGAASMLGLLLQVALIGGVAWLAWNWWQRRNQPAYASGPSDAEFTGAQKSPMNFGGLGSLGGLGSQGGLGGSAPADKPLELSPDDFNAFERLLGEILTAYGREDMNELRTRTTPEMYSYYAEELARNVSYGDTNQISDVKLLQGDLSEAWTEGEDDYATVAMRYSLNDRIVARDDGRLIEQLPSEATELWTFRRARGGNWILSAVQQTEQREAAE